MPGDRNELLGTGREPWLGGVRKDIPVPEQQFPGWKSWEESGRRSSQWRRRRSHQNRCSSPIWWPVWGRGGTRYSLSSPTSLRGEDVLGGRAARQGQGARDCWHPDSGKRTWIWGNGCSFIYSHTCSFIYTKRHRIYIYIIWYIHAYIIYTSYITYYITFYMYIYKIWTIIIIRQNSVPGTPEEFGKMLTIPIMARLAPHPRRFRSP